MHISDLISQLRKTGHTKMRKVTDDKVTRVNDQLINENR